MRSDGGGFACVHSICSRAGCRPRSTGTTAPAGRARPSSTSKPKVHCHEEPGTGCGFGHGLGTGRGSGHRSRIWTRAGRGGWGKGCAHRGYAPRSVVHTSGAVAGAAAGWDWLVQDTHRRDPRLHERPRHGRRDRLPQYVKNGTYGVQFCGAWLKPRYVLCAPRQSASWCSRRSGSCCHAPTSRTVVRASSGGRRWAASCACSPATTRRAPACVFLRVCRRFLHASFT